MSGISLDELVDIVIDQPDTFVLHEDPLLIVEAFTTSQGDFVRWPSGEVTEFPHPFPVGPIYDRLQVGQMRRLNWLMACRSQRFTRAVELYGSHDSFDHLLPDYLRK